MRSLPPVEPVDYRQRASMSLLKHMDVCPRSAYLYLRHGGGVQSHAMHRGMAFHRFAERALRLLVEQDENRIPPDLAKDIMAEVIAADHELVVPASEHDRLRQMAYHFAEGFWIDPSKVVAIERKFVLPMGDWELSGIIDFATLDAQARTAEVIDFKSAFAMASYDELATKLDNGTYMNKALQLVVYTLLLAEGHPVTEHPCSSCDGSGIERLDAGLGEKCSLCNGRGSGESYEPALGSQVEAFSGWECYPQYLFEDGIGRRGPLVTTRPELFDHRLTVEGLIAKLETALESWTFTAIPGSHCSTCPAKFECPLPSHLRDHAGTINTLEEAIEAGESIALDEDRLKARKKELRTWAAANVPVPNGSDRIWDFSTSERRETNWASANAALARAQDYGEPFDLADHQKLSQSTTFRLRKLSPEEVAQRRSGSEDVAEAVS